MFYPPPPDLSQLATTEQMNAALAAERAAVGDIGTFTLATLPDPAEASRRTAWVTDLFVDGGRMVSEGGFWKPLRPLVFRQVTASADMTIAPYVLASTIAMVGTIGTGITRAVTLGTGDGFAIPYPGYRTRILRTATGLGGLSVLGKIVPGWADWEWSGSAWVQTASGGLL